MIKVTIAAGSNVNDFLAGSCRWEKGLRGGGEVSVEWKSVDYLLGARWKSALELTIVEQAYLALVLTSSQNLVQAGPMYTWLK